MCLLRPPPFNCTDVMWLLQLPPCNTTDPAKPYVATAAWTSCSTKWLTELMGGLLYTFLSDAAASEPSTRNRVCKHASPSKRLHSRCAGVAACCRVADDPHAKQALPAHPAEDLPLLQQGPCLRLRGLLRGQALSSPCGAWGVVQLQRCAGHPGPAQGPAPSDGAVAKRRLCSVDVLEA